MRSGSRPRAPRRTRCRPSAAPTPTSRSAGNAARCARASGILEIANYGKHEVTGPGAEAWLDRLLAGRLPEQGRVALSPMLSPNGRLMGDFTVARLGPERFMIVGSGAAERFHLRWFEEHLPKSGVAVRPISTERLGFAIAGPSSRELLARVANEDVSAAALPFFGIRRMDIGCAPALVARVSFTGELGFEIYVDAAYELALYDALVQAGEELGLVHFGGRALNSLRLEKSFGAWLREYTPDYTPRRPASRASSTSTRATSSAATLRCGSAMRSRPSPRDSGGRRRRRRCLRRRAGARRGSRGRLRHLGRLWPHGGREHRARLRRAGLSRARRRGSR